MKSDMPRKAHVVRFTLTFGIGAALVFGAAHAVSQSPPVEPASPQAVEPESSAAAGGTSELRQNLSASRIQDGQSVESNRAERATPPIPARLKRIRYAAPQYPEQALRDEVSGYVTIDFVVNAKGEPVDLRIIDAHPTGVFEQAALSAVKRWRFRPLIINDAPAEISTRETLRFARTIEAR